MLKTGISELINARIVDQQFLCERVYLQVNHNSKTGDKNH